VAELLEPLQDVPPLGAELTALVRDVQQPAEPVVLGLEEVGGIVEGLAPKDRYDRLDER
jgi:hypothetical protein